MTLSLVVGAVLLVVVLVPVLEGSVEFCVAVFSAVERVADDIGTGI